MLHKCEDDRMVFIHFIVLPLYIYGDCREMILCFEKCILKMNI